MVPSSLLQRASPPLHHTLRHPCSLLALTAAQTLLLLRFEQGCSRLQRRATPLPQRQPLLLSRAGGVHRQGAQWALLPQARPLLPEAQHGQRRPAPLAELQTQTSFQQQQQQQQQELQAQTSPPHQQQQQQQQEALLLLIQPWHPLSQQRPAEAPEQGGQGGRYRCQSCQSRRPLCQAPAYAPPGLLAAPDSTQQL